MAWYSFSKYSSAVSRGISQAKVSYLAKTTGGMKKKGFIIIFVGLEQVKNSLTELH